MYIYIYIHDAPRAVHGLWDFTREGAAARTPQMSHLLSRALLDAPLDVTASALPSGDVQSGGPGLRDVEPEGLWRGGGQGGVPGPSAQGHEGTCVCVTCAC